MMGCCITGVSGLFLEHCTTVQQSRARERKRVRETPPTKTGWVSRESGPDFSRREQEMRREWKKQGGRDGSPPFWTLELKEFEILMSVLSRDQANKEHYKTNSAIEYIYSQQQQQQQRQQQQQHKQQPLYLQCGLSSW